MAPSVSSIGTSSSGRWTWYRSMRSVPSRASDASHADPHDVGVSPVHRAELRGDDHLVAPCPERPTEELLAQRAAVDVGGVEQGDAGVERRRARRPCCAPRRSASRSCCSRARPARRRAIRASVCPSVSVAHRPPPGASQERGAGRQPVHGQRRVATTSRYSESTARAPPVVRLAPSASATSWSAERLLARRRRARPRP